MRVFNLGLPGLRQDTLQKTLKRAGLRCAHWFVPELKVHVGHAVYEDFLNGRDPLAAFAAFDAVTQANVLNEQGSVWPQMDISLLRMVREYHPDCVFVLPHRDANEVLSDIDGHNDFRDRLTRWGAPGLPTGSAKFDQMVLAWIENHHDAMQVTFGADPRFVSFDAEDPSSRTRLETVLGITLPFWGDTRIEAASAA